MLPVDWLQTAFHTTNMPAALYLSWLISHTLVLASGGLTAALRSLLISPKKQNVVLIKSINQTIDQSKCGVYGARPSKAQSGLTVQKVHVSTPGYQRVECTDGKENIHIPRPWFQLQYTQRILSYSLDRSLLHAVGQCWKQQELEDFRIRPVPYGQTAGSVYRPIRRQNTQATEQ